MIVLLKVAWICTAPLLTILLPFFALAFGAAVASVASATVVLISSSAIFYS